MIVLLLVGLAGFAALPLLSEEHRLGAAIGWGLSIAMECGLNWRRLALMRARPGQGNLLTISALGFLAKLFLLATGAIVGAEAGLYSSTSYLLAFLAATFVGEGLGLTAIYRRTPTRPSGPS